MTMEWELPSNFTHDLDSDCAPAFDDDFLNTIFNPDNSSFVSSPQIRITLRHRVRSSKPTQTWTEVSAGDAIRVTKNRGKVFKMRLDCSFPFSAEDFSIYLLANDQKNTENIHVNSAQPLSKLSDNTFSMQILLNIAKLSPTLKVCADVMHRTNDGRCEVTSAKSVEFRTHDNGKVTSPGSSLPVTPEDEYSPQNGNGPNLHNITTTVGKKRKSMSSPNDMDTSWYSSPPPTSPDSPEIEEGRGLNGRTRSIGGGRPPLPKQPLPIPTNPKNLGIVHTPLEGSSGSTGSGNEQEQLQKQDHMVVPGGMYVGGVVMARGYLQYSDIRLKTNVEDIVDAVSLISRLEGKTYRWKVKSEDDSNSNSNNNGNSSTTSLLTSKAQDKIHDLTEFVKDGLKGKEIIDAYDSDDSEGFGVYAGDETEIYSDAIPLSQFDIPFDDNITEQLINNNNNNNNNHNINNDGQGKKVIGLIAQQVQQVLPEVVHEDEDGFLSVAYAEIVPVLISAFNQHLQEYHASQAEFQNEFDTFKNDLKNQLLESKQDYADLAEKMATLVPVTPYTRLVKRLKRQRRWDRLMRRKNVVCFVVLALVLIGFDIVLALLAPTIFNVTLCNYKNNTTVITTNNNNGNNQYSVSHDKRHAFVKGISQTHISGYRQFVWDSGGRTETDKMNNNNNNNMNMNNNNMKLMIVEGVSLVDNSGNGTIVDYVKVVANNRTDCIDAVFCASLYHASDWHYSNINSNINTDTDANINSFSDTDIDIDSVPRHGKYVHGSTVMLYGIVEYVDTNSVVGFQAGQDETIKVYSDALYPAHKIHGTETALEPLLLSDWQTAPALFSGLTVANAQTVGPSRGLALSVQLVSANTLSTILDEELTPDEVVLAFTVHSFKRSVANSQLAVVVGLNMSATLPIDAGKGFASFYGEMDGQIATSFVGWHGTQVQEKIGTKWNAADVSLGVIKDTAGYLMTCSFLNTTAHSYRWFTHLGVRL